MPRLFSDFFPPEVVILFNDRSMDGRLADGSHGLKPAQQEYFDRLAGFPLPRVFNIRQVHGDRIIHLTEKSFDLEPVAPQADAVITNLMDQPLAVRTADCLPVLIFDPRLHCLGLVHAGWRGTQQRIVPAAIQAMAKTWGCRASDLLVGLGPAIQSCCYEVGEEFAEFFPGQTTLKNGRQFFDLPQANKKALMESGVLVSRIADCGICTSCRKDFFSHRREGEKSGRHLWLLFLRK